MERRYLVSVPATVEDSEPVACQVMVEVDEAGFHVARCVEFPAATTQGRSDEEVVQRIRKVIPKVIAASSEKHGVRLAEEWAIQPCEDHTILRHVDGRMVVVPLDDEIGPGLLRLILVQAKMTAEEFTQLLS